MAQPLRRYARAVRRLVMVTLVGVGALLPSAAQAGPSSPAPASACSLTPTNGTITASMWVGAEYRTYRLRVPAGLTGSQVPLLLSLHGAGGNGGVQETDTGWSGFADSHNFIVAYPDGWWNLLPGNGWWESQKNEPNNKDITFIRQLVATISTTYCIDPQRIFVDGFSLGGGMSQRLACEADDLIAAVTAVGAIDPTVDLGSPGSPWYYPADPCTPSRPISVGLIHGGADTNVPIATGIAARDKWATRLGCPAPTTIPDPDGTHQRYSPCNAGAEVLWRTWPDQAHQFPQGPRGTAARTLIWNFFSAHPKP